MNNQEIDALGRKIADAAMREFARLCPEACQADDRQLEQALDAIRTEVDPAIDELMRDVESAPHAANYAFANTVLRLATTGVKAFKAAAH